MTATKHPFSGKDSLTTMLMPEYQRMMETCIATGLANPRWSGPTFLARRSNRHPRTVQGVAHSLANVVLEIRLQVGRQATLADAHQCMIHELAHAMVGPKEDHGPRFRETLRRMVRAHWPDIGAWGEVNGGGDAGAYLEDDHIISALERLYMVRRGFQGTSFDQLVEDLIATPTTTPTRKPRTSYGAGPSYVIDLD